MFSSNEYALRFTICHVCLQGLTGERRYTKSPPKTRSSIFSSKPYNASHYVPSFSSKVHKFAAPVISLSKKMSKMHLKLQLPQPQATSLPSSQEPILGGPVVAKKLQHEDTRSTAKVFNLTRIAFLCITSLFHHRSVLVVGRGWGISPPGWLRAFLI